MNDFTHSFEETKCQARFFNFFQMSFRIFDNNLKNLQKTKHGKKKRRTNFAWNFFPYLLKKSEFYVKEEKKSISNLIESYNFWIRQRK